MRSVEKSRRPLEESRRARHKKSPVECLMPGVIYCGRAPGEITDSEISSCPEIRPLRRILFSPFAARSWELRLGFACDATVLRSRASRPMHSRINECTLRAKVSRVRPDLSLSHPLSLCLSTLSPDGASHRCIVTWRNGEVHARI